MFISEIKRLETIFFLVNILFIDYELNHNLRALS